MNKFNELVELLGAPIDITVEELYQEIDDENSANVNISRENARLKKWLQKIEKKSRGKAREWARAAITGKICDR